MRLLPLILVAGLALPCAVSRAENPFEDLPNKQVEVKVSVRDDEATAKLKQRYNLTHAEIRSRYENMTRDEGRSRTGRFFELLNAVQRFHDVRIQVDPMPDERGFARQARAFLKEIEGKFAASESEHANLKMFELELRRLESPSVETERE